MNFRLGHIDPSKEPTSNSKFHIESDKLERSSDGLYSYYYSKCGLNTDLCSGCSITILFKNVCKNCLKCYTNKEIEELKFWLVLRKLKK